MTREIPMKQWLAEEAQRLGITPIGVWYRLNRGRHYSDVKVRRVNKRVVFVTVPPAQGGAP